MNESITKFIALAGKYMPFAKDDIAARAVEFQSLVDQGNRAIEHWGCDKLFAQFAVRYFHERNLDLNINRPMAQKEIVSRMKKDGNEIGSIANYSDLVRIICTYAS